MRINTCDGGPWFVAADVAKVLEHRDAATAVRGLDAEEKGTHNLRTPGGYQTVTVINASGLYSLIMTSRKDAAALSE